jgi:hypothetical protein
MNIILYLISLSPGLIYVSYLIRKRLDDGYVILTFGDFFIILTFYIPYINLIGYLVFILSKFINWLEGE